VASDVHRSLRGGAAGIVARTRGPLSAAAATLSATAVVALVDPHQPGHYPLCPFRSVTGLDCPFCGGLRATNDLAHGHVADAASHNLLLVVSAPLLVLGWAAWLRRAARPGITRTATVRSGRAQVAVLVVLVAFAVVRNTPWGAWLGS
jgi:hypothetical protein